MNYISCLTDKKYHWPRCCHDDQPRFMQISYTTSL